MKRMEKTVVSMIAVMAMVLSAFVCATFVTPDDVEGTDSNMTGNGTSATPYETTVKISAGQTKVSDIYVNETAFDFGYYFQYKASSNADADVIVVSVPQFTLVKTTDGEETKYRWDPTVSSWVNNTEKIQFKSTDGKFYCGSDEVGKSSLAIVYGGIEYSYVSSGNWVNDGATISLIQDGIDISYYDGSSSSWSLWVTSKDHSSSVNGQSVTFNPKNGSGSVLGQYVVSLSGISADGGERTGYKLAFVSNSVNNEGYCDYFKIKYTITSNGEVQTKYYQYKIEMYKQFIFDNFSFQTGSGIIGGVFSSNLGKDASTKGGNPANTTTDTVNFRYYVTGLPPGVSLVVTDEDETNGTLAIKGSVPDDVLSKNKWGEWAITGSDNPYSGKMNLSFAVTDVRTGFVVLETATKGELITGGVEVKFVLNDSNALVYSLKYGGEEIASQNDGDKAVTVVSSPDGTKKMILYGNVNNVVDVVKKNDSGSVISTTSSQLSDAGVEFDITGTGFYELHIRVPGISENVVTVAVIDDLIPVNSIVVTCGPANSNNMAHTVSFTFSPSDSGAGFIGGYVPIGTYTAGTTVLLPTSGDVTAPTGYTLSGWKVVDAESGSATGDVLTVIAPSMSGDLTFVAVFVEEPQTS